MNAQMTFQRYELKYLLNAGQKRALLDSMEHYMRPDSYGRTTIRNIYFDTEDFRLVRHSLEKPVYKEKLRIRSYRQASEEDPVFVELKKKYRSVVYKRRISLPEGAAMESFRRGTALPVHSQIGREIEYFRQFYRGLRPAMFLSYEREAFCMRDGGDFRVTLDENILYRTEDLSLRRPAYGNLLLSPGQSLLEMKCSGSIPLWMCRALNGAGIYKISFSKYGQAYCRELGKEGGQRYA